MPIIYLSYPPTWAKPTSTAYTASSTGSPWYGLAASQTQATAFDYLSAWTNQNQYQQGLLGMQAYNQGLAMGQAFQNQPLYEPRAPRIIRPHAEREALFQAEIMQARAREAAERTAAGQAERRAAEERAKELLLEHLTPAQRDTYTKNGWFIVQGGRSGQKYRINTTRGYSGNVDVLDGERTRHRLCAHLDGHLPFGDQIMAQKLMLEFDEDAFDFFEVSQEQLHEFSCDCGGAISREQMAGRIERLAGGSERIVNGITERPRAGLVASIFNRF